MLQGAGPVTDRSGRVPSVFERWLLIRSRAQRSWAAISVARLVSELDGRRVKERHRRILHSMLGGPGTELRRSFRGGWVTTEPERREPRGPRPFRLNAKRGSRSRIEHLVSGVVAEARNARIRRFRGERPVCRYAVPDRRGERYDHAPRWRKRFSGRWKRRQRARDEAPLLEDRRLFSGCVVRRAIVFDRPFCRRGTIDTQRRYASEWARSGTTTGRTS